MLWVDLLSGIVAFPGHSHLPFAFVYTYLFTALCYRTEASHRRLKAMPDYKITVEALCVILCSIALQNPKPGNSIF